VEISLHSGLRGNAFARGRINHRYIKCHSPVPVQGIFYYTDMGGDSRLEEVEELIDQLVKEMKYYRIYSGEEDE